MLTFNDVLVTPFSELLGAPSGRSPHKGGPIWPDWDQQIDARHCRGNKPIDDQPDRAISEAIFHRDMAWLGPIAPHFGHQIADFSMRIVPTLAEWKDACFICATDPKVVRNKDSIPKYFWQIVEWLGVDNDCVVFTDKASMVSHLHVSPQSEQIGGAPPSEKHLDLMDVVVATNVGRVDRSGTVFVSRAGQRARFAGEAYLEYVLARVGVKVIRPELLDLKQQLRCYIGAEHVIFSEGSALHSVQLLGRSLGKVSILSRREGNFLEKRIRPRTESLSYGNLVVHSICGLTRDGMPALDNAIGILDERKTLGFFFDLGYRLNGVWSQSDFFKMRDQDIVDWIGDIMAAPQRRSEKFQAEIINRLRDARLSHLAKGIVNA